MAAQENMVLRTVYLPKPLDKQLRTMAFANEQTKGDLIRTLVNEALAARETAATATQPKVKITTKSQLEVVAQAPGRRPRPRTTAKDVVPVREPALADM